MTLNPEVLSLLCTGKYCHIILACICIGVCTAKSNSVGNLQTMTTSSMITTTPAPASSHIKTTSTAATASVTSNISVTTPASLGTGNESTVIFIAMMTSGNKNTKVSTLVSIKVGSLSKNFLTFISLTP